MPPCLVKEIPVCLSALTRSLRHTRETVRQTLHQRTCAPDAARPAAGPTVGDCDGPMSRPRAACHPAPTPQLKAHTGRQLNHHELLRLHRIASPSCLRRLTKGSTLPRKKPKSTRSRWMWQLYLIEYVSMHATSRQLPPFTGS